jgi:hypothetical protein
MPFEYPDVMNDVVDARERYESDAVQFLAYLPRSPIPAGAIAEIKLVLQNIVDVPIDVGIQVELPGLDRKLRRLPQPLFQVFETSIQLSLANGEVAELIIPIHVQPHVPPAEYSFGIRVVAEPQQEGLRVRPDHIESRVGDIKIEKPQGLGISQIACWGYEAQASDRQELQIAVAPPGRTPEEIDLKPRFNSVWVPEDWDMIASARREANERRIYVNSALPPKEVFLPFMEESQAAFGDCGVRLHVGEAIFIAKMLTYTVDYFMGNSDWQDCLLVPLYAYARASDSPSDEPVWLVTQLGYTHVVELAIALSFSLVEEALGRQPWEQTEQKMVREFVVGCLLEGKALPSEFAYLPLILGGMLVADEVLLPGEDITDSLRLLTKAKDERGELFAEEDLRTLDNTFNRLLARKAREQRT